MVKRYSVKINYTITFEDTKTELWVGSDLNATFSDDEVHRCYEYFFTVDRRPNLPVFIELQSLLHDVGVSSMLAYLKGGHDGEES